VNSGSSTRSGAASTRLQARTAACRNPWSASPLPRHHPFRSGHCSISSCFSRARAGLEKSPSARPAHSRGQSSTSSGASSAEAFAATRTNPRCTTWTASAGSCSSYRTVPGTARTNRSSPRTRSYSPSSRSANNESFRHAAARWRYTSSEESRNPGSLYICSKMLRRNSSTRQSRVATTVAGRGVRYTQLDSPISSPSSKGTFRPARAGPPPAAGAARWTAPTTRPSPRGDAPRSTSRRRNLPISSHRKKRCPAAPASWSWRSSSASSLVST
jgi:hypothetical protein